MRALRLLLWPAGAALGVGAEAAAFDWSEPAEWLPDLAVGWTLIACGLVGWTRRPESRSGVLMAATGFAWFAANFTTTGMEVIDRLSEQALYLHRGPLLQLVLTFPHGRASGPLVRVAVAIAYVAAVFPAVWGGEAATLVLAALMLIVAVVGHARAVGRERRARLAALRATALLAATLAVTASVRLAFPTQSVDDTTLLVYEAVLCVLAIGLLGAMIREPWARSRVADLVVDLGDARSATLRDALAGALGDPTLEIGYRLDDRYVDAEGRLLALPTDDPERRVTSVRWDGDVIAVLLHDPAVLDDPTLSDALAGAARLAATNARLQDEVQGQLAELRASRLRLVRAGDEERQRLERRLRDTVVQRLAALANTLAEAEPECGERLQAIRLQLAHALDDLLELAAGIHPGGHDGGALAASLASLTARNPVPVELSLPPERLPEEVANAAYFVCSEALANVVKYAHASTVTISIEVGDAHLEIEVRDDGVGGADPARGTGLHGLADRVEALGGTLIVESPPGSGTRLVAALPLNEQAR